MLFKAHAFVFICGSALLQTRSRAADFDEFLRQEAGASETDLKRLAHSNDPFAKLLPNNHKGEIGVLGAIRMPVTIDFFIDRFRHIEVFKAGREVLGIGRFSDPPNEQDLTNLTLGREALKAIPACRPGKCGLKLSSAMMTRLRKSAESSGRSGTVEREFRAVLIDYVGRYAQKGTQSMISYDDEDPSADSAKAFLEIVDQFAWLRHWTPQFFDVLQNAPPKSNSEIDEFLYWSKESFGLKPVVSVTHVMIVKKTVGSRKWAFIASKQIYADHYLDASLGLTIVAEESGDASNALISLAYFNRTQTDGLRGWLASLQRPIVEHRVRKALLKNLGDMKQRLGNAYRQRTR